MRDMLAAIMGIESRRCTSSPRMSAAPSAEDRRLSGISGAACGRQEAWPQRCTGCRAARKPSTATTRAATMSRSANLRSTTSGKFLALRARQVQNLGAYVAFAGIQLATNNFARCFPAMYDIPQARYRRAMRLHQHAADRPLSRRRTAGSQLRDRAAGRGSRARHRHRPRRRCASAISFRPPRCRTRPRSAPPSTAANFRRFSTRRWRSPSIDGFKQRKRELESRTASCAGFGISCFLEHSGGVPNEGALAHLPRQGHAGRQPECRQSPARAMPRSIRGLSPRSSASTSRR